MGKTNRSYESSRDTKLPTPNVTITFDVSTYFEIRQLELTNGKKAQRRADLLQYVQWHFFFSDFLTVVTLWNSSGRFVNIKKSLLFYYILKPLEQISLKKNLYTLFRGLVDNTRGCFTSCLWQVYYSSAFCFCFVHLQQISGQTGIVQCNTLEYLACSLALIR